MLWSFNPLWNHVLFIFILFGFETCNFAHCFRFWHLFLVHESGLDKIRYRHMAEEEWMLSGMAIIGHDLVATCQVASSIVSSNFGDLNLPTNCYFSLYINFWNLMVELRDMDIFKNKKQKKWENYHKENTWRWLGRR